MPFPPLECVVGRQLDYAHAALGSWRLHFEAVNCQLDPAELQDRAESNLAYAAVDLVAAHAQFLRTRPSLLRRNAKLASALAGEVSKNRDCLLQWAVLVSDPNPWLRAAKGLEKIDGGPSRLLVGSFVEELDHLQLVAAAARFFKGDDRLWERLQQARCWLLDNSEMLEASLEYRMTVLQTFRVDLPKVLAATREIFETGLP